MNRIHRIICELCFLLIFIFLFIGSIHADDPSYSIDRLNINCQIEKNGAIELVRTVTYNFNNDAHGLTYQQELPQSDSPYTVKKVEIADNMGSFHKVTRSNSHHNNTYSVLNDENSPDIFKIKTYHKIDSGQLVTIRYIFTMADAVTNYRDAARLNYKIIGFDTNVPQKNINITFDFRHKNLKLLKAWIHAGVNLQKQISAHNGTVKVKIHKLPANEDVEADILFPNSVTFQNPNTSQRNIVQSTMKLENKINHDTNHDNKIRLFKKYLLIPSIIILYAIIRFIIYFIKIKRNHVRLLDEVPHNFEIPTIPVALADAFFTKNGSLTKDYNDTEFYSHAFAGELLQLHNQNKIKITQLSGTNYSITLIDKTIVKKDELYDVLFNKIGNGLKFTTNQISNIVIDNKKLSEKLNYALNKWYTSYTNQVDKEDINPKAASILNNNYLYLYGTSIILGTWWLFFLGNWISLILLLFLYGTIYLMVYLPFKKRMPFNDKGLVEYKKIVGFKKMLLDIGNFKNSKLDDLLLWKDILPYAVGFGISNEVLNKLTTSFSEAELRATFNSDDYFYFYDDNHFDVAFSNTFSSISDSSSNYDSFSNGDSGGFGGNSGDGAF